MYLSQEHVLDKLIVLFYNNFMKLATPDVLEVLESFVGERKLIERVDHYQANIDALRAARKGYGRRTPHYKALTQEISRQRHIKHGTEDLALAVVLIQARRVRL